jgi:transposase-like protein
LAADRFRRIDKHNNKIRQIIFVVIVVDETLVKIDGLEYWLWVGRLRA